MSGPPEGWYDDPDDGSRQRWWDGERWTEHRRAEAAHDEPQQLPDALTEGWYPDPGSRGSMRWWDGERWTSRRRRASLDELGADPLPVPLTEYHQQTSAGTVAGGFKFGCGFFLFIFVGLPVCLMILIALLTSGH